MIWYDLAIYILLVFTQGKSINDLLALAVIFIIDSLK